jgi:hypothetical protein
MEETWWMIAGDVAQLIAKAFAQTAAATMVAILVISWCLLVLVVTGRLPWMVRRYF